MAVAARFCGNCGAPLAPGAPFCGRCGAPAAAAAAPVYPAYQYPRAQPGAHRLGGDHTMQIAVAIGLIAILVIVTVVISAFAIRNAEGTHQNCTSNCRPKIVTPLPASATYKSTKFRFEVDYSANWSVQSQDESGIELSTRIGAVSVSGSKETKPLDQVIQGVVNALPSANWQNVTPVTDLKGAHLGDQNGLGKVYSANLIGSNSTATKVRFAVIAAARGGVTVVMFAVDPADTQHFANGMPEGQLFDYMCTVFRWGT
jgi:zinc ribbon protein